MNLRRSAVVGALAVAVVGMVAAYRLGRARADGVPTVNPLFYGGVLEDGGRPVEGTRNVTVRLWDAATAGSAACTTSAAGTVFSGGRFRVALDTACAGAVRANPNLWAEVQVEATTFPRSKLGAVPYALEAGRATGAAGALEARLATIEARAHPRQVEIGRWTPSSSPGFGDNASGTATCDTAGNPYQTLTVLPNLTFEVLVTGLYRISAVAGAQEGARFRIATLSGAASVFSPIAVSVRNSVDIPTISISTIYRLEAGRSYSFALQGQSSACSGAPWTYYVFSPLVAEQLN